MHGQASPARADLEEVVVGAEPELGAEPVELGALCIGELDLGSVEDRGTSSSWSRRA